MPFAVYPPHKTVGYGVSTTLGNILAVAIDPSIAGGSLSGFQYSTDDGVTWIHAGDNLGIYVQDWVWDANFGFVAIGPDKNTFETAIEISDDLVNWTRVNTNFSDGPLAAIAAQH